MGKRKLLEACGNCGCRRYKDCGCVEPKEGSRTQLRKKNGGRGRG